MVEVTKFNFESIVPNIKVSIEASDFIAIDTEFTGIKVHENDKPSLFDDGAERYRKLRLCAARFTVSQIGLSAFVKNKERNTYEAQTYNFYLFPKSFGCLDRNFVCQPSSLDFLVKHKFDFNKFVYEGISFMNEEEEKQMQKIVQNNDLFLGKHRDVDEDMLQEICSQVAQWLVTAKEGHLLPLHDTGDIHTYILHSELRSRFKEIWTTETANFDITVAKVTKEERIAKETKEKELQGERLLDEMLGFTKVFREIVKSKKLILGHNNFVDLVMMYEKFHKPLPASYSVFKRDITAMFPQVCDTKHVVSEIRKPFVESGLMQSTGLSELYKSLSSDKGRSITLYSPDIKHAQGFDMYNTHQHAHEAGFDAYMCGYVFLRMAHLWSTRGVHSADAKPVSLHEYIHCFKPYLNHVNVIRAAISHMCLDGPDPESQRPQWLYVKTAKFSYTLQSSELARLFSAYGSVDIKVHNPRQALVAVGNHRCAREILRAFHKNENIIVRKYSVWKHSPVVRNLLWCGLLVSGTVCIWTVISSVQKT